MNKFVLLYLTLILLYVCTFSYDANGNQTTAPNGLTITYNSINQPQQFKSGSTVKYKFAYLADGRKLHSITDPANDGGLAYIGSSVFNIGRGAYTSFESTSFSAGRIVRNGSGAYTVQYHITDHLGSVRASFNNLTCLQENSYNPYGTQSVSNLYSGQPKNNYLFNGKEQQTDIAGFGFYNYGARFYDPALGRWHSIDPLAEKYYSWSPYNFCVGNPLRFVDPDGRDWYEAENGSAIMWRNGSGDIEGYKNIGTEYTMDFGSGVSMTFDQNTPVSMTFTGAKETCWESQIINETNCYVASAKMLQNEGVKSAGRDNQVLITTATNDGRAGDANTNANIGLATINQALENNTPIIVGVDYKIGSPNEDGITDHFIVISSKTELLNNGAITSATYNFFDPRTSHKSYGTSSTNQLKIFNNKMIGSYNYGGKNAQTIYNYTVTSVRRNK